MAKEYELYFTIAEQVPYVKYIAKGVKILELIYNFGREGAVERAVRELQDHVAVIALDIAHINERIDALTLEVIQIRNLARVRLLVQKHTEVQSLAFRLGRDPDVDELADIANTAALLVNALFDDSDLWLWNDIGRIRTPGGQEVLELAEAEFKLLPLPVLSAALTVFALSSSMHMALEPTAAASYAANLTRFLTLVSVRNDWIDGQTEPISLPEQVRARITVVAHALTNHVTNGQCVYGLVCVNRIERTSKIVQDVTMFLPPGTPANTLCMAPANLGQNDESFIEDEYAPIVILGTLEQMLGRLKATRTLADPPIPQFPNFVSEALTLYAVEPGGRLISFEARFKSDFSDAVAWQSPRTSLGTQWGAFKAIMPGHWNVLYGVKADNSVLWNRHDGAPFKPSWSGPTMVSPSSHGLPGTREQYIAGSNGTMYRAIRSTRFGKDGIKVTSELIADRHLGVETATGTFADPVTIHANWPLYVTTFGGTGDVIYGIDREGRLFWHKHMDASSGGRTIKGPIQIGIGWNMFVRTFCAGGGYIFGVVASGRMVAYHFLNWQHGPSSTSPTRWLGPVSVPGTGWNAFLQLVPILQAPLPIVK